MEQCLGCADIRTLPGKLRWQDDRQLRRQLQLGEMKLRQLRDPGRLARVHRESVAYLLELTLQLGQHGADLREIEPLRDDIRMRRGAELLQALSDTELSRLDGDDLL